MVTDRCPLISHAERIRFALDDRLVLFRTVVALVVHCRGISVSGPLRQRRTGIEQIVMAPQGTWREQEKKYGRHATSELR
jgi:hypothetical protein